MDDYQREESVGSNGHVDRLSELPQSLIFHILSFLPIRDVVSTTLLSKHWENMWTLIPCLNFSHILSIYDGPNSVRIRNFVNRALISWEGTKLLKCILDIGNHFEESLTGDMDLWVCYAVKKNVEELNISLRYGSEVMVWSKARGTSKKDVYMAPQCLNTCSSIRKLILVGCNLRIHESPSWDQLKSLKIDGFYLREHLINQILLGSPRLEEFELCLIENNENLSISSASLKKLNINKYSFIYGKVPSLDTVLRINCPDLETLNISGSFYSKYLFTNVSSLTDATLDFQLPSFFDARGIILVREAVRQLFSTVSTFEHVQRVTLSHNSVEVLTASKKKNMFLPFSPVPSVVHLKIKVLSIEVIEMVRLLEIFPNIKMLVIEDRSTPQALPDISEDNYLKLEANLSDSFLHQLKIIEITSNFYDSSMFQCMELFLKRASVLEKLVARAQWAPSCLVAHLAKVAESVPSLPRSSPAAKEFLFSHLRRKSLFCLRVNVLEKILKRYDQLQVKFYYLRMCKIIDLAV